MGIRKEVVVMDKDKDDVEELVPYSLCYRALTFFITTIHFPFSSRSV